jgi:hypothetical protein
VHTARKLLGLLEIRQLALHPDGITVGRVGNSTVHRAITAALEAVVALPGTRGVPVKVDFLAQDAAGDGAGLGVG